MTAPLLEVRDLATHFFTKAGVVKAVDGVSFSLQAGEIVGLVGESGSGKTTIGKAMLRLYEPSEGRLRFAGADITRLGERGSR